MWIHTILLVLAFVVSGGLGAAPAERQAQFPQPGVLDEAVAFWTRVYTEVDYNGGFIHDNRHLNLVYETLRLRPKASPASQRKVIRKAIKGYRKILLALASGKRAGLSREQRRVLDLWGENTSAREFKAAAKRLRFQRGQANRFRDGMIRAGAWEDKIRGAGMGLRPRVVGGLHVGQHGEFQG